MFQHSSKLAIAQLPTCLILCLNFLAPSLAQAQRQNAPTEVTNHLGMILKRVAKGEFLMGSPSKEIDYTFQHAKDELQHRVQISYDFYIGQEEVTQSQFEGVMNFNPSYFSRSGAGAMHVADVDAGSLPVEQVSWFDAIAFCNKLSELEGLEPCYKMQDAKLKDKTIQSATVDWIRDSIGYRLPTEAEWEYACRAVNSDAFAFGSVLTVKQANFDQDIQSGTTRVTGRSLPNAFGLRDMHANVREWCWDVYDPKAYDSRPGVARDPVVSSGSDRRVNRGGCWYLPQVHARSADRFEFTPDGAFHDFGFRVVKPVGR